MTTGSSRRLEAGALALVAAAAATLAACTPPSGQGLPKGQLDTLVGQAIGDPSTCLLLADRATGKVVYQYGDDANCARPLPECDAAGVMNARAALRDATQPGGRMQSCPSVPDGSRTVGWAEGRVQSAKRDLVYSAVMEGQNALPGHEINARLYDAFQKAGL
jgi:hypothetical protein